MHMTESDHSNETIWGGRRERLGVDGGLVGWTLKKLDVGGSPQKHLEGKG